MRSRAGGRRRGSERTLPFTRLTSPPRRTLLPQRLEVEAAEELHLVLELDAELLACSTPCLVHQSDRVGAGGTAGVLDEVRVPRGDLRAADSESLQTARLEHSTCAQLVIRILEDAAERPLVRRLCGFPLTLQIRDDGADLFGRAQRQADLDLGDDLSV